MANKTQTIRIESIWGGESQNQNFAGAEQFSQSFGIDPDFPADVYQNETPQFLPKTQSLKGSGFLRPTAVQYDGATTNGVPMWMVDNPKNSNIYIYDNAGSIYSTTKSATTVTGLGDLNDDGVGGGHGASYYDNYIYFARATTVARYGPLDGTPVFTDSYWITTLGQAPLTYTSGYPYAYPLSGFWQVPEHFMKRHTDGALYFADVVGNQGVLHKIKTTKTTVEGDTNNGSTFNVLDMPFGYWPTCIESYNDSLVVGLYSGGVNAKIIFWDTIAESPNQIIDFEFPDIVITKILNVNGFLYVFSSPSLQDESGLRISRYLGGNSFEEIAFIDRTNLLAPDAVDQFMHRFYFGGHKTNNHEHTPAGYTPSDPEACVHALGTKIKPLDGVFTVFGLNTTATFVSSVKLFGKTLNAGGMTGLLAKIGWYDSASTSGKIGNVYSAEDGNYDFAVQRWRSEVYRIGQPFKITKVRVPILNPLEEINTATGTKKVVPVIYCDEEQSSYALDEISSANCPKRGTLHPKNATIRPVGCVGQHSFFLEFQWYSPELITLGLPITIEYELLDD